MEKLQRDSETGLGYSSQSFPKSPQAHSLGDWRKREENLQYIRIYFSELRAPCFTILRLSQATSWNEPSAIHHNLQPIFSIVLGLVVLNAASLKGALLSGRAISQVYFFVKPGQTSKVNAHELQFATVCKSSPSPPPTQKKADNGMYDQPENILPGPSSPELSSIPTEQHSDAMPEGLDRPGPMPSVAGEASKSNWNASSKDLPWLVMTMIIQDDCIGAP